MQDGAVAGLVCTLVLGLTCLAVGKPPVQVLNAASQWLWGREAGQLVGTTLSVTGVGLLTQWGAATFWAAIFRWVRRRLGSGRDLVAAMLVPLAAVVLDYGILPERLSLGWHLVLPLTGVLAGFVGLGLGLWLAARRPMGTIPTDPG